MTDCGLPFTADEMRQQYCRRCGVLETAHAQDTLGRTGRDRRIDGEPVWVYKLRLMRFRAANRVRERVGR